MGWVLIRTLVGLGWGGWEGFSLFWEVQYDLGLMGQDEELKRRILELQQEVKQKDLELARYRTELAKTNTELESIISDLGHELKMASHVQRILSPTQLPNIQGIEFSTKFVPGTESGGDYFDIFEHEDRLKFGLVVASSSGYSMSALFLSVLIKLAGQIEARKGMDPDQVISSMAKELLAAVEEKDRASVFYGFVDRRSFEFKFCSVGNIIAYQQIYGTERLVKLAPCCGPLRKNFDEKPLSQTISLNARDRLILCTEGLTLDGKGEKKAKDVDGLEKSILRAARSGVHDVRNEILFQWEQTSQTTEPKRDLTVVVAEVKDRVIKLAK